MCEELRNTQMNKNQKWQWRSQSGKPCSNHSITEQRRPATKAKNSFCQHRPWRRNTVTHGPLWDITVGCTSHIVCTSQRQRATFLNVLLQRAAPCTWAYMNTTPSLPHSHIYLCSARFIVIITHQHGNDRNLQSHVNVIACVHVCTTHQASVNTMCV